GPGNQTLQQQLDDAARAYNDAKGRLDASHVRQGDLQRRLEAAVQRLGELNSEVGPVAAAAYRGSRVDVSRGFLNGTGSPAALLHDAATVQYLAERDDREIRDLVAAKKEYADQKTALDSEVKIQEQQLAEMEKRKNDAQRALGNPKPGIPVGAP